jgi:hypothetical protein
MRKDSDKKEDVKIEEKKPVVAFEIKEESKEEHKITDEDIADFKAWKAEKAKKNSYTCDAQEDDKIYALWKEESKMVKGIFRCREPIGGSVHFFFRKFKWDKTKEYKMMDGEIYEIPLAVARHLNKNCSYAQHSNILDAQGNPTVNKDKMISRMNFESTEFATV